MDEIANYNKERWEELAQRGTEYAKPYLNLTPKTARQVVDPEGLMGEVSGKNVLCLASGGGQQSVAFGLLGANVTVLDLSETQLKRDEEAAAHYCLQIRTAQGDMRDLSRFGDSSFDVVWQAFSINFVPDVGPVIQEVARVLRVDGLYRTHFHNPFVCGIDERDWTGDAYPLKLPYVQGAQLEFEDPCWDIYHEDGTSTRVEGPKEFRHTLSTMVNTLTGLGFVILGLWEEMGDPDAEPGSWDHFKYVAPPWLRIWAAHRPYVFG
jgi:SAM-dependent methyltransferase